MGHIRVGRFVAVGLVVATLVAALPARAATGISDVPSTSFAASSVNTVVSHDWLRAFGGYFHPRWGVSRKVLARAVVLAFPQLPQDPPDNGWDPQPSPSPDPTPSPSPTPTPTPAPGLTFSDLPATDSYYKFANAAVKLGWMTAHNGKFDPNGKVTKSGMDATLVRALGLTEEMKGLTKLATADGYVFPKPSGFAAMIIANELHLNYNYHDGQDEKDLYPWDAVTREYFAYALANAADQQGWAIWSLQGFRTITLPKMTAMQKVVVRFALRYAGYPYVYAGEWYRSGFGQEHGGFDCSGFQWWVTQHTSDSWPVAKIRPYKGWSLGARRASLIAKVAPADRKVWSINSLRPADLIFFDADGNDSNYRNIDHGGMSLGNGWFIHSTGSRGGVTIGYLGEGSWWHDSYVMGRRLFG